MAAYREGCASILPTTAAIEGFRESPAGGWVMSAPRKMIGSLKIRGRTVGSKMLKIELIIAKKIFKIDAKNLLTPPNLTFIFRQRFERVCGVVLFTFFA